MGGNFQALEGVGKWIRRNNSAKQHGNNPADGSFAYGLRRLRRSVWITVVASGVGIAVSKVVVQPYFDQRRATAFDRSLVNASSQWNAKLPMRIDKYTRLDWTVPGPGKRFTCMYTLLGISAKEIDPTKLTSIMRPQIVNGYKTIPELAPFWKQGVEVRSVYRDTAGKYVTEIVVSPKDFQ